MKRKIFVGITICLLLLAVPFATLSHSGRTDGSGGHRDNKNKSGLGSYHYHCGGNPPHLHTNGVCPYKGGASSNVSNGYSSVSSDTSSAAKSTPARVYASRIEAVNVPATVSAGESVQLEGKVYPLNAEDSVITWTSKNPEIATISKTGFLSARDVGTAIIVAETERGVKKEFAVKISEFMAESIEILNKPTSTIKQGEALQLTATVLPEDATDKTVRWFSENEDVASIDKNGMVQTLKSGKVTISAETVNGLKDTVQITVESDGAGAILGLSVAGIAAFVGINKAKKRKQRKDNA